jgi:hypothetical protein
VQPRKKEKEREKKKEKDSSWSWNQGYFPHTCGPRAEMTQRPDSVGSVDMKVCVWAFCVTQASLLRFPAGSG